MQASGIGNIMGMLLKKQSVLLTLMDLVSALMSLIWRFEFKTNSQTQQMLSVLALLNFIIIVLKIKKIKLDSLKEN